MGLDTTADEMQNKIREEWKNTNPLPPTLEQLQEAAGVKTALEFKDIESIPIGRTSKVLALAKQEIIEIEYKIGFMRFDVNGIGAYFKVGKYGYFRESGRKFGWDYEKLEAATEALQCYEVLNKA